MSNNTLLTIILVLLLFAMLPTWPYSAAWGLYPSSAVGVLLLIVVIVALTNRSRLN